MAPYESLYGRRCRSLVGWFKVGETALIRPEVDEIWKEEKLSPSYVGPYKILKKIGKDAYELELPTKLAALHPVFYISLLKKCVGDPASTVPLASVAVKDSLSYEDVPVEILELQVKRLRNKEVASVKVLWRSQSVKGAIAKAAMKAMYPYLFPSDSTPA
ncbi:uncharacterized protein [Solanum lycopersicum]|uniref:uncharacterized protein n=1 Tax=Solanum lycopersicum TaxID=4081 RepID=UPI003749D95B